MTRLPTRGTGLRLGMAALLALLGPACGGGSLLLTEGNITVRLRNVADFSEFPVYLCSPGYDNAIRPGCNMREPPAQSWLDYGQTRDIVLPYKSNALDGSFYAYFDEDDPNLGGKLLGGVAICRSLKTYEALTANRPEVVWDGFAVTCTGW